MSFSGSHGRILCICFKHLLAFITTPSESFSKHTQTTNNIHYSILGMGIKMANYSPVDLLRNKSSIFFTDVASKEMCVRLKPSTLLGINNYVINVANQIYSTSIKYYIGPIAANITRIFTRSFLGNNILVVECSFLKIYFSTLPNDCSYS